MLSYDFSMLTVPQLVDVANGTVSTTLEGHTGAVVSVAFSAGSSKVATASEDGTVKLWDLSGSCTCTIQQVWCCCHDPLPQHTCLGKYPACFLLRRKRWFCCTGRRRCQVHLVVHGWQERQELASAERCGVPLLL